jgi:hypothetical protein
MKVSQWCGFTESPDTDRAGRLSLEKRGAVLDAADDTMRPPRPAVLEVS